MDLGLSQSTVASARERLASTFFPGQESSSAFVGKINEVIERFHNQERWISSLATFRVDISVNKNLYLPYYLDSINGAILDTSPAIVQGPRYEFMHDGPGLIKKDAGMGGLLLDLGMSGISTDFPVDDDDTVIPSTLTVSAAVASDVGKVIRILGYDADGNIITDVYGSPGEEITLEVTPVVTTSTFSGVKGIQKEITTKPVTITHTSEAKILVRLEASMKLPFFRCYRVLDQTADTAIVLCKRRPVPVFHEEDYIFPGDLGALKLALYALQYEETSNYALYQQYMREAITLLNDAATSYMGAAQEQIDFAPWGMGVSGISNTK